MASVEPHEGMASREGEVGVELEALALIPIDERARLDVAAPGNRIKRAPPHGGEAGGTSRAITGQQGVRLR